MKNGNYQPYTFQAFNKLKLIRTPLGFPCSYYYLLLWIHLFLQSTNRIFTSFSHKLHRPFKYFKRFKSV